MIISQNNAYYATKGPVVLCAFIIVVIVMATVIEEVSAVEGNDESSTTIVSTVTMDNLSTTFTDIEETIAYANTDKSMMTLNSDIITG